MSKLELRIPPLALAAAFAGASAALSAWWPLVRFPFPGHRVLGVALVVAGAVVAALGVVEFRRVRTTVNPMAQERATAVVSSGIYRWSRNPMYLGFALALAGLAAWGASLAGVVLVPLFCAYMNRFQIAPEERALLQNFGPAFAAYMDRVRRWI